MSDVASLIVAAGEGTRFGGDIPKVFVSLAGDPILLWALRSFDACTNVDRILLAVADPQRRRAEALCHNAQLHKPCRVIGGGDRRQDTVLAGLREMQPAPPDIIAIHDGARPLIRTDTIAGSIRMAEKHGACIAATPVTDTIKQVANDTMIEKTLDRRLLWRAQTPQTFRFQLLLDCYERAIEENWHVTDDASVVERSGHTVRICPTDGPNPKITVPADLRCAEALIHRPNQSNARTGTRVGTGYDVHAFAPDRKLILGGVHIPHDRGLAGHSDADVLMHAACDAVLGAAAAGDIGSLFPDTDPDFEGRSSTFFCKQIAQRIRARGYQIVNLDTTIIAQCPRLAPHVPQMRENLARAFSIHPDCVSVKATTTEGLGFEGRREGIAAHATAALRKPSEP